MRCGLGQFHKPSPEFLKFAKEYGATDILLNQNSDKDNHLLDHNNRWELKDLVSLRRTVERYGMKLSALENVPTKFYDHIMLGGPKRDEQIENMIYTIRNIARAGIPIFGYNWMPSQVWRTKPEYIRGNAEATAFDYTVAKDLPLTLSLIHI